MLLIFNVKFSRALFYCFAVGGSLLLLYSCSGKKPHLPPPGYPKPYKIGDQYHQPLPSALGYKERGIASWYGRDFHGKRTSNGEIYNMYAMTAAHKTLPLGTIVKVRNLDNKKEIEVRVNDRGPFVRGRIIDLSYKAAQKIGIADIGLADVEVIALIDGSPSSLPSSYYNQGTFAIQVGAFSNYSNAQRLKSRLDEKYKNARIISFNNGDSIIYRVRVGKFSNAKIAETNEQVLIDNGFKDAFTIAE